MSTDLHEAEIATAAKRRYDVVGFLGAGFGLGVAARNTIRALESAGRLGKAIRIEPPSPRWFGRRYAEQALDEGRRLARRWLRQGGRDKTPSVPPAVTLFQMNPLEIAHFKSQWRDAVDPSAPIVCVPFWEMPLVPEAWTPVLQVMDFIMAPTRFVQEACSLVLPSSRVLHYPQAVFLPEMVRPARDRWGLSSRTTVFAVSFDVGSDIERKNPYASVEAFRRAFPSEADVELVIKMKPWPQSAAYRAQAESLRRMIGADRRVRVIEQSLGYVEVLELYASCDVMLSLHRSEGLGLHLMEAMSLAKVVVGTNWSGNVDFMTSRNSVPVGYRLVPVATRHTHYGEEVGRPGQVWAEPEVGEAARAMARLHSHPEERRVLGAMAARDMEARRKQMLSGAAYEDLERALALAPAARAGALARAARETRRGLQRRRRTR